MVCMMFMILNVYDEIILTSLKEYMWGKPKLFGQICFFGKFLFAFFHFANMILPFWSDPTKAPTWIRWKDYTDMKEAFQPQWLRAQSNRYFYKILVETWLHL